MDSSVFSVLLFAVGAAVGSFLNVLAFRYDPDKPIFRRGIIGGRSHCMGCGKTLLWYELIPIVSFVIQRGRCRSCGMRLSIQYPFLEILGGLIAFGIPFITFEVYDVALHRIDGALPLWYFFLVGIFELSAFIYLFISAVDARLTIIPDQSNLLLIVFAGLKIWILTVASIWSDFTGSFVGHYAAIFGFRENILLNHIVAALFGLAFFGIIWGLSRGRAMGMGDVKLAGVTGLLLGWPDTMFALLLAFIVGALFGILLIVRRKKNMKSSVAFGPFVAIGVALIVSCGQKLMDGYFALFP
ncbi:MAG: prepilin peptidase [Patescibacteria group bacterium]